jgi:hypothetical protein
VNEKLNPERDAEMVPQGDAATDPEAYWCVYCGRAIAPERHEDGNVYIHDNKPHPVEAAYDEDQRPQ